MVKVIQLVTVPEWAKRKRKDKSWVYELVNDDRLTAYQIPGKKLSDKPQTFLDPAEEPSEKLR